ncbi:hypothetical protein L227DRAFT_54781 [Lentinus tigrinus ALCF2SS1-6]|uniref:Uncharacterized protein n=1 Tax=Lentinus tigrinus ALCF2SS1-6 TaxID=1328759 RepID=A0A5C2SCQ8_9APHY|nr:hypothetical protein L227DRAFT_54781 [Lentinus tigrinus ALCF2SS1-6]
MDGWTGSAMPTRVSGPCSPSGSPFRADPMFISHLHLLLHLLLPTLEQIARAHCFSRFPCRSPSRLPPPALHAPGHTAPAAHFVRPFHVYVHRSRCRWQGRLSQGEPVVMRMNGDEVGPRFGFLDSY